MVTRSRKWQLTINNPLEHQLDHERIKDILNDMTLDYWCMCDETGEEGTYHTHLYIYSKNPKEFSYLKKAFNNKAHIENCKGTSQQNRDYIRKEGEYLNSEKKETNHIETFEEFGECPQEKQGQRNDIKEFIELILDGNSYLDIIKEYPIFMRYDKQYDRIRKDAYKQKYSNTWRNVEVEYIFGSSGLGKTRYVMDTYGYENVYRITNYDHPFDEYEYQKVIIFEEFRSSAKIGDMLNWLDGYPIQLPCRYNDKYACFEKVFIISNISLDKQYVGVNAKSFNALLRRITKISEFYGTNQDFNLNKEKYRRDESNDQGEF